MDYKRKSVGGVVNKAEDGEHYVFVARGWPRWIGKGFEESEFDAWDKSLAPSRELLNRWRDEDMTWGEWENAYVDEIGEETILDRVKHHAKLAGEYGKEWVVFVCYESEDERPMCHTWTILDILDGAP